MIERHMGKGQEGALEESCKSHEETSSSLEKHPRGLGKAPQASPAESHCLQWPL